MRARVIGIRVSVAAFAAALVAAGASASIAGAAGQPVVVPLSETIPQTLSGACSFDIAVNSTVNGTETVFSNSDGSIRIGFHYTEVDSFSANGITLTGEPYVTNEQAVIDASGNLIKNENSGEVEDIVLPSGTVFFTAGRSNSLVWPPNNPGTFVLQPQFGRQGDLAAFCAALS